MAYDENLAARIADLLTGTPDIEERKMFGGVGYMLKGNMACGVHKDFLIVRVGPEKFQEALDDPHTKVFDITGRPMTGWVMVASRGFESDADLGRWIDQGVSFAKSLPSK